MCCNNGCGGGGNCCWIIILLIIIWCCCGSGGWGGCNNGCGRISGRGSLPWGLNQTVRSPAFDPPRMSEVRLSPTMTVSSNRKPGMAAKQASKNALEGLSAPISSEMKMPLK